MKITKLLPLALVLMLACPAFADVVTAGDQKNDTAIHEIDVPKFIRITRTTEETLKANASFTEEYDAIDLDAALTTTFHVVTNNPDDAVKLTATAKVGTAGTPVNAITGSSKDDLRIVLTNIKDTTSRYAEEAAVTDALKDTQTLANNANAIAFHIEPSCAVDPASAGAEPTPAFASGGVTYPLQNGIYDFTFTMGQTQYGNTFSTHDADGLYQATLTLSQVPRP